MIDEETRLHVTQFLPSQSARDLYEAIMTAWVKWARAPRFLLVDTHRPHLGNQFIEQLGARRRSMDPWSCGTPWSICAIHGGKDGS